MDKDYLILKRASASRPSGEWNDDDFDVLCDGVVVGRLDFPIGLRGYGASGEVIAPSSHQSNDGVPPCRGSCSRWPSATLDRRCAQRPTKIRLGRGDGRRQVEQRDGKELEP